MPSVDCIPLLSAAVGVAEAVGLPRVDVIIMGGGDVGCTTVGWVVIRKVVVGSTDVGNEVVVGTTAVE